MQFYFLFLIKINFILIYKMYFKVHFKVTFNLKCNLYFNLNYNQKPRRHQGTTTTCVYTHSLGTHKY